MAISSTHFAILKHLYAEGLLPQQGHLLEIGEANLYGDFDLRNEAIDYPAELKLRINDAYDRGDDFAKVKCLYDALFKPKFTFAIDMHGQTAETLDLNICDYTDMQMTFDTVINHGTAEHIFDIANVFRLMHDVTTIGALMLHESPLTGWIDHGFYCLQPTLFWDVAAANEYEIVLFAVENIDTKSVVLVSKREDIHEMHRNGVLGKNPMLFVVFRKNQFRTFSIPMQGVYAGTVNQQVQDAWRELR